MSGQTFPLQVLPQLPEKIARLEELSSNFWFSWHRPTRRLFNMLDHELWWKTARNPKVFLRCVDQGILETAATNETFLGAYRRVLVEFDAYHEQRLANYPNELSDDDLVAYFCAEYGYHESFPNYSGGLGILAGDHCKTASDMRLPFVAIGLLYRRGYFRQLIDGHGNQVAEYPHIEADDTPVTPLQDENGNDLHVYCEFPGRQVAIKIWGAQVGRVAVLLLDTGIPENDAKDQEITRNLYGGDSEMRLQQEIILGIGGVRALRAAGMSPTVWHVNEGHSAFQVLERARELIDQDLSFSAAIEAVAAQTVFTTHTPVAAGHDFFQHDLMLRYMHPFIKTLRVDDETVFDLGRSGRNGTFDMTRLAIAGARAVNGVSRIHAGVSSEICRDVWPDVPPEENPIGYVTNGVHVPTFMREEWGNLLEDFLGPAWRYQLTDRTLMQNIRDIPPGRFWYVGQRVKSDMLMALRERLQRQFARNQVSESHGQRMLKYIDPENPDVLTIGFGRRFATYKRATLLFKNLEWLREIVDNEDRPVVFIFAGKAHPADEPGKAMLKEIHHVAGMPGMVGKILLVEGYDMGLGRLLTAGVDIWLNTPTYPLEASGTSGMKAAINGTVNLSVLDGWWAEAYDGHNGWVIPPSANSGDTEERDRHDARTLYEILQDNVIPLYYDRDRKTGYSSGWVDVCKRSMATVLPHFNFNRVLHDYTVGFYGPAARRGRMMAQDNYQPARELAEWKSRARAAWPSVKLSLVSDTSTKMKHDARLRLAVDVMSNGLGPEDVRVECVLRRVTCSELTVPVPRYSQDPRAEDGIRHVGDDVMSVVPLEPVADPVREDTCRYELDFESPWCGALTYEIRAVPQHPHLSHPYDMGLMHWL
ncbi:MAG: alpha-glucan family phosphorylase [Gammaproteobacteria bacterium]